MRLNRWASLPHCSGVVLLIAAAALSACASQLPEPSEPDVSPELPRGVPARTLTLPLSISVVEGCSESEISDSYTGTLTLEITPGAEAALIYDGTTYDTYYSRRDKQSKQHRRHDRVVWAGRADEDEDGTILIRLAKQSERCMGLPLYGDGPGVRQSCMSFYMKKGEVISLRCSPGAVKVITPPDRSAGTEEVIEERPAVRCHPGGELPYPLSLLVLERDLSFPLDAGIEVSHIDDLGLGHTRFQPIHAYRK
jgi:hypothetical protein